MEKTDTFLPLDFPPLLALATEATRSRLAAVNACGSERSYVTWEQWGSVAREWEIEAHARLLRDLTRRESQAVWLGWLAREVGVPEPVVGAPEWTPMCDRCIYQLGHGRNIALFIVGALDRLSAVSARGMGVPVIDCLALDNPDAPDAPIRALVLAVLTVGSRGGA